MKTMTPMLCSLLAAIATAGAQNTPPPVPVPPVAPLPPTPAAGMPPAADPAAMPPRIRIQAAPAIEVPALRAEQIAEPVRWKYRFDGDLSEFPLANRKAPVTFLGVSASPPPSELAPHLPIDEDTGLVVEFLAKDGPAAKAGLQERDVLAKLDDQILIHPRQLAVLVANHKEGDKVKFIYVRKGQLQEATATLAKQDPKPAVELHSSVREGQGSADVFFYGNPGSPLKTFVRRLQSTSGESGGAAVGIVEGAAPTAGAAAFTEAYDQVLGEQKDTKAELDAIRKMLEDLTKRLEEKE